MGKKATPSNTFTKSQCASLTKNRVFGSDGPNSWESGFNHRHILIEECLYPVLKSLFPSTADVGEALHILSNTELVLLGCQLAPSRRLEHIIRLGIVARTTQHRTVMSNERVVEILMMTTHASSEYVSNLDYTFRDTLPDLIAHIKKIDSEYQEAGKPVFMFGNITDKTPEQLEDLCSTVYIPAGQRVSITNHADSYGVEILSLQEKVQYLIDNTVLNFYRRTSEQRTPKFLEWFDRYAYLGKSNAMIFSINQMMAHVKLDKNKVATHVKEPVMAEKESQAQLSKLMLNIRLALMSTNKHPRSVLAEASDDQLLAMAADSIDSIRPAPDVYFKCGDMQYTRAECEQLILDTFDIMPKDVADFDEGEFREWAIHAIFMDSVEDTEVHEADPDPLEGKSSLFISILLEKSWSRKQMEDHLRAYTALDSDDWKELDELDDHELAHYIADLYGTDEEDDDDDEVESVSYGSLEETKERMANIEKLNRYGFRISFVDFTNDQVRDMAANAKPRAEMMSAIKAAYPGKSFRSLSTLRVYNKYMGILKTATA